MTGPDVTRTIRIGELIEAYPHVVPVLREAGVHCVGCGVSAVETLEEGLEHHGRGDAEIDAIVARVAEAAAHPENTPQVDLSGVEITIPAAIKFGEVIRQRGKLGCALRISVIGAERSYRFEIDDTKRHDDQVLTIAGTRFYIDSDSRGALRGTRVDYSTDDGTFRITKPA